MSMKVYQEKAPLHLQKLAHWLRNSAGVKVRSGVIDGQRKEYFKGKEVIKALCSDGYKKFAAKQVALPKIETQEEASALLSSMLPFAFFLRVDKGSAVTAKTVGPGGGGGGASSSSSAATGGKVRALTVNPTQEISGEHHYAWLIEAGQVRLLIYSFIAVSLLFAGVLFPLWPPRLRVYVWYLSMGFLGLVGAFIAMAIFRLIFFVVTWFVASPGLWIFPNLFEDVGVVESFIPFWEWEGVKTKPRTPLAKKSKGKEKNKVKGKGKKSKETAAEDKAPLVLNDAKAAATEASLQSTVTTAPAPASTHAPDAGKKNA